MDVAQWTNAQNKQFMFTHVLDEATLFHRAVATGRTQEDQFAVLADSWFKWQVHVKRFTSILRGSMWASIFVSSCRKKAFMRMFQHVRLTDS